MTQPCRCTCRCTDTITGEITITVAPDADPERAGKELAELLAYRLRIAKDTASR